MAIRDGAAGRNVPFALQSAAKAKDHGEGGLIKGALNGRVLIRRRHFLGIQAGIC
jgi:hypothetical protein